MRRLGLITLAALASCTLDPRQVLKEAALHVHVEGVPPQGLVLVLTALDSSGRQLVKRAPLSGARELDMLFEKGTLAEGAVDLGATVLGDGEVQLACGAARGEGTGSTVELALTLANDDSNCGACGRACDGAPHATRACDGERAACGALQCASGWFDVNGDAADGCETTCAAPTAEDTPATCRDGSDDDCDGATDCADQGCGALVRSCAISTCTGQQRWDCASDSWGTCVADSGLEGDLAACTDGQDNDCDGKTDCLDEGCGGLTRTCTSMMCTGEQPWICATNTWGTCTANSGLERDAAACSDGEDNDCDGKRDCDDDSCAGISRACTRETCSGMQDWTCATNSWSACAVDAALEATTQACSDGQDNDCDGQADCQDAACLDIREPCGANLCVSGLKVWLCSSRLFTLCLPYVALPENNGLLCGDGLDNDCDGVTDCADSQCAGLARCQ